MDLSVRSSKLEIMDTERLSPNEMARTLDFLALTNRWFGGAAVVTRYLEASVRGGSVRILDVGTGAGDIPLAIAAWARSKKLNVHVVGLDLVPEVVAIARERTANESTIEIREGDLFALAKTDERFDFVTASLFLHHMPGQLAWDALRAMDRLATRGVMVSDLRRSWFEYATVTLASWVFGNRVVRHDGPVSVERSFTCAELQHMADQSQLNYLKARREPWCRLSLSGVKS